MHTTNHEVARDFAKSLKGDADISVTTKTVAGKVIVDIIVTGKAGTVVIMNAHMWHGGTANRTARCRRALHAFYTRDDKPQQQYQKALLRPETIAALTPLQRRVLAIDDPENDRLSSATTRMSGFLK